MQTDTYTNSVIVNKRLRCIIKFLRFFQKSFYAETYISWERGYKWQAPVQFQETLNEDEFTRLLAAKGYSKIA
jgi:hypothetical protein